jgi:ABC-type nitrate/sulfonate/bicarbonate transport system substrate-binding protein
MLKQPQPKIIGLNTHKLRVGFVPLTDCAPLVMAEELGLYQKYGLNVRLHRELGWASIRDKVVYGELDAAHAIAGLPFAATLGLGSMKCDCLTGLVMNLNGNGITLSNPLARRGVTDAASLRAEVQRLRGERTMTFGIVSPVSSHHFLLRAWLASAGINPDRDVRIVVVPPPQMVANLRAGNLDGFCVGEPWNSVAVLSRVGVCVAVSAELDPGHPEKVLMVRQDFAEAREEDHLALLAAVLDACHYCDVPENHERIIEVLSRPQYVGVSAESLRCGITGRFDFGGGVVRNVSDFNAFHRYDANEPSGDKAAWVMNRMRASSIGLEGSQFNFSLGRQIFRADIFEKAIRLRNAANTNPSNERNDAQTAVA